MDCFEWTNSKAISSPLVVKGKSERRINACQRLRQEGSYLACGAKRCEESWEEAATAECKSAERERGHELTTTWLRDVASRNHCPNMKIYLLEHFLLSRGGLENGMVKTSLTEESQLASAIHKWTFALLTTFWLVMVMGKMSACQRLSQAGSYLACRAKEGGAGRS